MPVKKQITSLAGKTGFLWDGSHISADQLFLMIESPKSGEEIEKAAKILAIVLADHPDKRYRRLPSIVARAAKDFRS
jgi:hypothetical protein